MRKIPTFLGIAIAIFMAKDDCLSSTDGHAITNNSDANTSTADSINAVAAMSDDQVPSFIRGIIPPSPQAAELARYAEYPVGYSSGIPSISVPLYEIRLGSFTLPISISYHASGSRPDQMPTCVGLGWSLNAGGAISRTILGKPDMYYNDASASDYTYFDDANIRSMLDEVAKTQGGPKASVLGHIISDSSEDDTESDRYTFNVAGRTGVFIYSYADHEFLVLNNSNDVVKANGSSNSSSGISFSIKGSDGIAYEFAHEEKSGAPNNYNGGPFTSSWYLTRIETPYGDITFTYEQARSITDFIDRTSNLP